MKVAGILQGDPRFCEEFDLFLNNLIGFDQVDWFCYFWKSSPNTATLAGSLGHQIVSPFWQNLTIESASERFRSLLPPGHKLAAMELADQNQVPTPSVTENFAKETLQSNVWKMWNSQWHSNRLRIEYEQRYNIKYDLIVRTRPDVALLNKLNLGLIQSYINLKPHLVVIPQNKRCGYDVSISDLMAVCSGDSFTTYANVYHEALTHHKERNFIFHPETMLARHLLYHNLDYQPAGFNIEFRYLGVWKHRETGKEYDSASVPNWFDYIYYSKFGRWE